MITLQLRTTSSHKAQLIIPVLVTPKSSRDEFLPASKETGAVRVRLCAVPEDGKANEALLRFFAKQCGIPKSSITLASGQQSRHKRLAIALDTKDNAVILCQRLGQLIGLKNWQDGIELAV